ncbi:MAG TPA: ABC transporter permease [Conexivisphaerales archaeon]|nr:ABC transporter permease [Conexivisphaerales archaeon]
MSGQKTIDPEQVRVNKSPLHGVWALTNRELKKWYKAPFVLAMSLVQPLIWMGLFGKAMNIGAIFSGSTFNIPGVTPQEMAALAKTMMLNTFGTSDYFSYLAVGMLSFITLFTAMFTGMSIVWDRRFGILNKFLSTPISRNVIPVSKVLNSAIRGIIQAAIVLVIAVGLGMDISHISALGILGTFVALFLMLLGFGSLFVTLALRATSWETQMALMNLLNLPLLFASNAMFPVSFMPTWLQPVVRLNPVSYAADISRQLLLGSPGMTGLWYEFLYLGAFAIIMAIVGQIMARRLLSR